MMPFQKLVLAVVATTVALPTVALADAPPAQVEFIRGRITSITAEQVQVKTTAGKIETVNLAPKWTVQVTKPISVSEIKTGSFIGTAEMPQKDGTGRSLEVPVFPAGVKAGEGHYSWGLKKGSMMTNGTVGTIVASPKGQALDVDYSTGIRHIVIPTKAPIVEIVPGTQDLAKVGARVFIGALPTPKGLMAGSIQVGENGSAPPM